MPKFRIALLCYFVLCCPFLSLSQKTRKDKHFDRKIGNRYFSLSAAYLTTDYLLDGYHPGPPKLHDYTNKGPKEALCISYKYQLSKKEYIGLTGTFEQQHGDWLYYDLGSFNPKSWKRGVFIRSCYTIAGEFNEDYFSRGLVRMYMTIGVGFTYENETTQNDTAIYYRGYQNGINEYGDIRVANRRTHVNAYVSPFGISVGRKLSCAIQGGYGYKGVVNAALTYKLLKK